MGFELMDLLQSTVFKSEYYSFYINGIGWIRFRLVIFINAVEPFEIEGWKFNCGNEFGVFLAIGWASDRPKFPSCNRETAFGEKRLSSAVRFGASLCQS